ncbi:hypothetical protein CERSUDRAFT_118425 [Gelatoporia subvermispora B]|uniref:Uncharacterized protein n=1 Tax=Ceriporiopsis subvermispora (strain B) TaxID=914234 RepID=M2R478_CERS8|nr:hypothetical protein CERSUDRAFT_118425 [Gelatoporia subvermispora B]
MYLSWSGARVSSASCQLATAACGATPQNCSLVVCSSSRYKPPSVLRCTSLSNIIGRPLPGEVTRTHSAMATLTLNTNIPSGTPSRSCEAVPYPTSPLPRLLRPAPAPLVPSRLRERRGVSLRICTGSSPFMPAASCNPCSPTARAHAHVHPHRNNLPRRRGPKKRIVFFEGQAPTPAAEAPPPHPAADANTSEAKPEHAIDDQDAIPACPVPPPTHALSELAPNLSVAFSGPDSPTTIQDGVTHIVEISLPSDRSAAVGSTEETYEPGVRLTRLRLVLPAQAQRQDGTQLQGRMTLALTDTQLRRARDFLAQAILLPSNSASTRALITAPPGHPAEMVALAACYLAFARRAHVTRVLKRIDADESVHSAWKGEVSGDEAVRVEGIARGWSWLDGAMVHRDEEKQEKSDHDGEETEAEREWTD